MVKSQVREGKNEHFEIGNVLRSKAVIERRNGDDAQLWKDFTSGDEGAFIVLYKKYANVLYGYGCRFSSDQELVKDCLQDFFVYLREKRSGLGQTSSIKLYLFKAFKRRILDYIRKKSKEREKRNTLMFDELPQDKFYETLYFHQQEEGKILNLNRALKDLSPKEREAIYYFYYQGLTYEEISELLDFSHVSSARRLIYRSLSKMRSYMTLTSVQ